MNALRETLHVLDLSLVFVKIEGSVSIILSEGCLGCQVNINAETLHVGGALEAVLDLLDGSASHDDFVNVVSSELLNESGPVF